MTSLLVLLLLAPSSVRTDEIGPEDDEHNFLKKTDIQMDKEDVAFIRFEEIHKELAAMLEKHANITEVKGMEAVDLDSSESLETLLKFIKNDLNSTLARITDSEHEIMRQLLAKNEAAAIHSGDVVAETGERSSSNTVDTKTMHRTQSLSKQVMMDSLSIQEQISEFHKIVSCKDDHQAVHEASKGNAKTCQEALKLYQLNEAKCKDDLGFGPLSELCPRTCEICKDPYSLLERINSLSAEVSHAHALLKSVAAAIGGASSSTHDQAYFPSSRSLFRNPRQELKRFAMEIKLRYEKGTLMKPIIDTVASVKDLIEKLSGKDAKEL